MAFDPFAGFFDDPESWTVFASGLSECHLSCDKGPNGKIALRLDYDFHKGKGFVVARKEIQAALPSTFEFKYRVKGKGPRNNFEFKIADPSGSDVWRYLNENFEVPGKWTVQRVTERDLPFAWGPLGGGAPSVLGAIELVIAAGEGGKGSILFSDLSLEDQTMYLPKRCSASSAQANYPAKAVFIPGAPTGWHSRRADPAPEWRVDFGFPVRFGGLVIHWPDGLPPREFEVAISDDGEDWTSVFKAARAIGTRTHVPTPRATARHLRIAFSRASCAGIASIQLKPDAFSHSSNDFIHSVAADHPRGWYPRYWCHEQSYWTPIGGPQGRKRALINEEGLVETDEGGFSLEPFLIIAGMLVTWADVECTTHLTDDGVPMPSVVWKKGNIKLTIQPWMNGGRDALVLRVAYRLEGAGGLPVRLAVAARPFQVNPPWQAFRNLGGRSPIQMIHADATGMTVEGHRVFADRNADGFGAAAFEEEGIVGFLNRNAVPERNEVIDPSGLGSGALVWDVPGDVENFEIVVSYPYFITTSEAPPAFDSRETALQHWREVLGEVKWEVPDSAAEAIRCFRTAAGHILIDRDGAAIQPGPRRYTRSWVRDCVIMGAAMAKAGLHEVLREFLEWYAQFQQPDGSIPAVVDRDGVDPIVEHDSHGQFLWAVCEVHRIGCDPKFLEAMWPHVKAAAEFAMKLRRERLVAELPAAERSACHGLFPESASHEGYLAHPVHSYWDDFWGVRGLEAAAELGDVMKHPEEAKRWHDEAKAFLADVLVSIDTVIRERGIDYVPGSVEWADFDPTATANAIAQLDFSDDLPVKAVCHMLEKYLTDFRRKHRGEMTWLNYTAYEIRIIGAYVRMGKRDEAHELLEFFLSDRRPLAWNQWPEISWRDPRSPGHLGDVPHTWIAAEYMLAVASMVASEREGRESMVLASGLSWKWITEGNGFGVTGLGTRFGDLDFHMRAENDSIHFSIAGVSIPPGGLLVSPPLPQGMRISSAITDDGKALEIEPDGACVNIPAVPVAATLILQTIS